MEELKKLLGTLEPGEILTALTPPLREALSHLDEEERQEWLSRLLSDGHNDNLVGMVNL